MLSHTRRYRDSLREDMRRQRLAVSERDEELATASVMQRVLSHPYLEEGRLIGSYVSTRHEIGTRELNRALTLRGHTLALPVISPVEKGIMDFYTFDSESELILNRFAIPEPPPYHEKLVTPPLFEVLLVPLLAFDLKGNRMGMGGGYYDRTLKQLSATCVLIGLAYDFQMVPAIQTEAWDMPLDEVITPSEHYVFSRKYLFSRSRAPASA